MEIGRFNEHGYSMLMRDGLFCFVEHGLHGYFFVGNTEIDVNV